MSAFSDGGEATSGELHLPLQLYFFEDKESFNLQLKVHAI